jgi:hypothetical protein
MPASLVFQASSCISFMRMAVGGSYQLRGFATTQIRRKGKLRPRDLGVVVRLLDDIPGFGRRGM